MRRLPIIALWTAAAVGACDSDATSPVDGAAWVVRMEVSGGIAGVDYAFELHDDGAILGIRCEHACAFQPGDTLGRLTPAQRETVTEAVWASGLPDAGGQVDFGSRCCDQFGYRVSYTSGTMVRSFTGSSEALPESLRDLVRTLHLLLQDTPPLIVSQTTGLDGYALDGLSVVDARVVGGLLEVDVTYGGGCAHHDVDAVAYTGWMESFPVQIGVALTHDAHGDTCEALIQRTLRFDLEPLANAYRDAYGPGGATLVLRIGPGAGAPGGATRLVSYTF